MKRQLERITALFTAFIFSFFQIAWADGIAPIDFGSTYQPTVEIDSRPSQSTDAPPPPSDVDFLKQHSPLSEPDRGEEEPPTPIAAEEAVEAPTVDPISPFIHRNLLTLRGTKPSGTMILINGRRAEEWAPALGPILGSSPDPVTPDETAWSYFIELPDLIDHGDTETLSITAKDDSGKESLPVELNLTLEQTKPTFSLSTPLTAEDTISQTGVHLEGTAADEHFSRVLVSLYYPKIGYTLYKGAASYDPQTQTWQYDIPKEAFIEGQAFGLSIYAYDAAGNKQGTYLPLKTSGTPDTTPPDILVSSHSRGEIVSPNGFLLSGTVSDGTEVSRVYVKFFDPVSRTFQPNLDRRVLGRTQQLADLDPNTGNWSFPVAPNQLTPHHPIPVYYSALDTRENASSWQTIELVVKPQPPSLSPIGKQEISLGSTLTLNLTATDPDEDQVTFRAFPLPLPANAAFNVQTGAFRFSPQADQVGTYSITFTATDGVLTDSETVDITVKAPLPDGDTSLTGRVLDTNDYIQGIVTPVVGATISLLGTGKSVTTDLDGRFTLLDLPSGSQIFDIDTSTASEAPDGSTYAGFREELALIQGAQNTVDRPFFLPRNAMETMTPVDPETMTMVVNPTLEVTMEVPPHTAKNPDGSDFTAELSISLVPEGLAPAALPDWLDPGLLITIQPVGVSFATPVPITFPNIDNLASGAEVNIWSLDPEQGIFVVVGKGRVTEDGSQIETISGGIRAADWHFAVPPLPPIPFVDPNASNSENQDESKCQKCSTGSQTSLATGSLTVDHTLVSYRSLGESRAPRFVYSSFRADPQPIITVDTTVRTRASIPQTVSSQLSVGGVDQGLEVFTDTSSIRSDTVIRQGVQFDASGLETGLYPYLISQTSNYAVSRLSSSLAGTVLVRNDQANPFGVGWALEGLDQLTIEDARHAVIAQGDGSTLVFTKAARGVESFTVPIVGLEGSSPRAPIAGDFNRDGLLDFAAITLSGNNVIISLGKGGGDFTQVHPAGLSYANQPSFLASGDFNGDDTLDLAVTVATELFIYLGDGAGNFSEIGRIGMRLWQTSVASGDFNQDGFLDLVATDSNDAATILYGDGAGNFFPTEFSAGDLQIQSTASGDFNGDGILDFAAARPFSKIAVFIADENGNFGAPIEIDVGFSQNAITAGDFNGDQILDLAVGKADGTVRLLLGDGAGNFLTQQDIPLSFRPEWMNSADFNGDTFLDLAATDGSRPVELLFGDGQGGFSSPSITNIGDGIPDLVTLSYSQFTRNTVSIFANDGSGMFSRANQFQFGDVLTGETSADLNKDGLLDLVLIGSQPPKTNLIILLADGKGGFSRPVPVEIPTDPSFSITGITASDSNADGIPDLLLTVAGGPYLLKIFGNGSGGFTVPRFETGQGPLSTIQGDFNRDRITDLAMANSRDNNISVRLGGGNTRFSDPMNLALDAPPTSIASADFDRDSILDLVVTIDRDRDNVIVYQGDGTGAFNHPTRFTIPDALTVAAGDFDGDGAEDLV